MGLLRLMGSLRSRAAARWKLLLLAGWLLASAPASVGQVRALPTSAVIEAGYVSGETLAAILPDLGDKGGISIAAGPNCLNRRLFLITQGRSLGGVMSTLRRFVPEPKCQAFWFRSGSGSIFDEDLASVHARKKRVEAFRAGVARANEKRMAKMRDYARDKDGAGDLRLSRKAARRSLALSDQLPPYLRNAALQWRGGSIELGRLPAEAQNHVRMATSLTRQEWRNARVALLPMGTLARPSLKVAAGPLDNGAYWAIGDLFNPVGIEKPPGYRPPVEPERRRGPDGQERDPRLLRKVSVTAGEKQTLDRVLLELCSSADLPLVGEYDPGLIQTQLRRLGLFKQAPVDQQGSRFGEPGMKDVPVHEALEEICRRFDLDWDFREGWIELRSPRTLGELAGIYDLSPPGSN